MKRSSGLPGWVGNIIPYAILIGYSLLALFPVVLTIMNSFKSRRAIFTSPLLPPTPETFSLVGYETVASRSNFGWYFVNSIVVTVVSMVLILIIGAMAAWALSGYSFRGNTVLGLYLALGIMIPIRLGTVSILRLVVGLGLDQHADRPDPGLYGHGVAADNLCVAAVHAPGADRSDRRRAHRRRQ